MQQGSACTSKMARCAVKFEGVREHKEKPEVTPHARCYMVKKRHGGSGSIAHSGNASVWGWPNAPFHSKEGTRARICNGQVRRDSEP